MKDIDLHFFVVLMWHPNLTNLKKQHVRGSPVLIFTVYPFNT